MSYKDIKTFFDRCQDDPNHQNGMISEYTIRQRLMDEIVELRNYIEQAEKQEPVANRSDCGHKEFMPLCQMCQAMGAQAHSYTAPPRKEWVGLTELEIAHGLEKANLPAIFSYRAAARAGIDAFKEKNT